MKSSLRLGSILLTLAFAFGGSAIPFAAAQPPPADPPKESAEKTPATAPAAPGEPTAPDDTQLRRLDLPERSAADAIRARAEEIRQRAEEDRARAAERADADRARARARSANRTRGNVVNVFADSSLPAGERGRNVVAVFGDAFSDGDASGNVVTVFGDNHASGPVGENVVAVFGDATVKSRVDENVVAVFGDVTLNSHVGSVVAVFGDVKLGPLAEVDQEVVCVMGQVERDPGAVVHHQVQSFGRSFAFGSGISTWMRDCLRWGRPLAFHRGLEWAWLIALSFLGFYLFLALLFRGGVEKCTNMLENRPGAVALTALGSVVLTPFAIVLLCIIVVGIPVVPFLAVGLFIAGLFGKAVVLAWLGRRVVKIFGPEAIHPAFAVLVGGALVLVLYTVPVLGFISYKIFGWLGLGAVLLTLLTATRRKKAVAAMAGAGVVAGAGASGVTPPTGWPEAGIVSPSPVMPPRPPPIISAVTLPRAGFWIRFGALWIDLVLLAIGTAFLAKHSGLAPFCIPIYAAVMWRLKGTTVGGVVCNLQVVRLDGREVDWTTAIVRSLACFLSLAVFGLGFIWVAVDDEKQSWHDKIAGTTVVRVPKGMSLL